jgi:hypothetical protein
MEGDGKRRRVCPELMFAHALTVTTLGPLRGEEKMSKDQKVRSLRPIDLMPGVPRPALDLSSDGNLAPFNQYPPH